MLLPILFANSRYAERDVIGDTAVIANFKYQTLKDFYHKWYRPDLQAIIVVGDVNVDQVEQKTVQKKDYVLYFGRYSQEKGIATLVQAAKELPQIPFIFAGSGPLEDMLKDVPNIKNVGFQRGEALEMLIREARFTVYPSEWYENCPFSVMES